MFKSSFNRAFCLVLIISGTGLAGFSEIHQDTLIAKDPGPETDSTLLFLTSADFNRRLDLAIHYQGRADSLHRLSIEWRKEAVKLDDPVERGRLQHKIMDIEDSVLVLRALADEQFMMLGESLPENSGEGSAHPFLVKDTVLNGITVYNYNLKELTARLEEATGPATHAAASAVIPRNNVASNKDSTAEMTLAAELTGLILSDTSPYGEGKPFERDFPVPPGVFYRIQLAVYQRDLPADHFGGLSPITTEYIPERDLSRYFVGKFTRMDDAKLALKKVRANGFKDAFIIGYYDGVKASFSKLRALEK